MEYPASVDFFIGEYPGSINPVFTIRSFYGNGIFPEEIKTYTLPVPERDLEKLRKLLNDRHENNLTKGQNHQGL